MSAMLSPVEFGHQMRDMVRKLEVQTGLRPQWVLCAHDIAPMVTDALVAAKLPMTVHVRDDMPPGQNFQMGSGELPT